jgi:transcriptional regulator with XRE-family HTH domain
MIYINQAFFVYFLLVREFANIYKNFIMITPLQALLARTMTGLSQQKVAGLLGWAHQTLSKIENGDSDPPASRLRILQNFYEARGVDFLMEYGIRRHVKPIRHLFGAQGFSDFLDDVFQVAIELGQVDRPLEIFLSNVVHANWITWLGEEKWKHHAQRMFEARALMDVRIITKENDFFRPAINYATYRWLPNALFNEKSFYSYHDRLAFLDFQDDKLEITIMYNKNFAEGYRNLFRACWEQAICIPDNDKRTK